MTDDLSTWTPRALPDAPTLEGRYVRLERLDAARHGDDLHVASTGPDADALFTYMPTGAPHSRDAFDAWLADHAGRPDPAFYAVVDIASGRALGRQALMRIDAANGVAEAGNIFWGPGLARTRGATEALYLFARYLFDELGYRRFEWKCDDANAPSKRAAGRFGFRYEGLFRKHLVVKGRNRDTAWFSILDDEWQRLRPAYDVWLDPANFSPDGRQRRDLKSLIDPAS